MKKALRRVQRSLSRDRFGSKKNPRSNSQESIDSNLTNKSQNTRPPSELSQVSTPGTSKKGFGSSSTLNSSFDRGSQNGKSFRENSISRLKNIFGRDKSIDDNESLRSARSNRSTNSGRSSRAGERGRSTDKRGRLAAFSGQKYLVKVELSIRRAGTRPVFTQRTEIVMDNNPATKTSPRPHFPMPMVNTFLDQNGSFCLRAEVLGYPAPSVMFYKDDSDEPLMAQSQLHKTARSPLGMYELVAENTHGSVACKAHVLAAKGPGMATVRPATATPPATIRPPSGLPPNGRPRFASNPIEGTGSIGSGSLPRDVASLTRDSNFQPIRNVAAPKVDVKKFLRESPANSRQNSIQETGSSSSNLSLNRKPQITSRRDSGDFSGKTLSEVKSQMKSRRLAPNFGNSFDHGDQSPPSDPNEPEEVKTPVPVPRVKFDVVEKKPEVPAYCGPPVIVIII